MNPVLVPQAVKHDTVQLRFEHVVIDFVVLVCVQTKVVNFFSWYHTCSIGRRQLIFFELFLCVIISISSKASDFNLASRNSALRINDDCNRRILDHLHALLSLNVNARKPAAIARVRMVPANHVFGSFNHGRLLLVINLERSRIVVCADSCLCAHDWQTVDIHDVHRIADWISLHRSHHFNLAAALGMHGHLNQRHSGYLYLPEVVWVLLPWSFFL